MAEWQKHRPSSLINRSLLVPKFFNLFYYASTASLTPFYPIYFRLLGLTAFQSGLIGAGKGLVSFWSTPMWCLTAEKTDKRKCLLLLMLLIWIALNMSLALIHKDSHKFGKYLCNGNQNKNFAESNFSQQIYKNGLGLKEFKTAPVSNTSRGKMWTTFPDVRQRQQVNSKRQEVESNLFQAMNYSYNENTFSSVSLRSSYKNQRSFSDNKLLNINASAVTFVNFSSGLRTSIPLVNETPNSSLKFVFQKNYFKKYDWFKIIGFRIDATFKIVLVLILVTEFLCSPVRSLSDSLTSDIAHWSKAKSMTAQKVWGSFGFILGAAAVAVVIGYYGCYFGLKNIFLLHFYIFTCFSSVSFLFGMCFQSYDLKAPGHVFVRRTCSFLCCDLHTLSFILILLAIGVADSLHSNFMMWYLYDISASKMVMGLILIATGCSELLMHVIAPYLIRIIGQEWVMFLSLLSYGGRFLYFSYIRNQWLIIPIELLHGVSQTAMWHACKTYSVVATPHGMEKTMQAIFEIMYKFFGLFIGGVGVSLLYQLYGPVVVFRCAAGVCGLYCVLYALLQCILGLPEDAQERRRTKLLEHRLLPGVGRIRNGDRSRQADWLLEALDADEEENIFSR